MARKSSSPRRIRAIQATASDASQQQQQPTEENSPRKRGRPRRSLDSNADAPPGDPKPKRKRGRPSLGPRRSPNATQGQVKRKRGRPSLGTTGSPVATTEVAKKKRGRPSLGQKEAQDGAIQTQEEETGTQPSKRGQKKKPQESVQEEPQETEEQQPPPKRKRGRPSLKGPHYPEPNNEDAEAEASPARRPRGRPPGSRKSPDDEETSSTPRRHQGAADHQGEEGDEHPPRSPSTRRRTGQTAQLEADAPPKAYPHVAPRVRAIKQATIDAKWRPLSAPSIAAATETLALAHRPIMQRIASTQQRRQHASAALSVLHRRIARKLHRGMPFPPPAMPAAGGVPRKRGRRSKTDGGGSGGGGHEAELDFESVLDGARALERRLDPALHAVELLRKEKEWMERELEQDYKTLRNLEAGARGQARQQREQLKKAHVLAPEAAAAPRDKTEEDVEMVFDHKGSVPPGAVFKDLEDEELKELALQLGGHVDSIKINLQQTEGLVPQMASSGAALRSVLLRHLSQDQYDKVVLG